MSKQTIALELAGAVSVNGGWRRPQATVGHAIQKHEICPARPPPRALVAGWPHLLRITTFSRPLRPLPCPWATVGHVPQFTKPGAPMCFVVCRAVAAWATVGHGALGRWPYVFRRFACRPRVGHGGPRHSKNIKFPPRTLLPAPSSLGARISFVSQPFHAPFAPSSARGPRWATFRN